MSKAEKFNRNVEAFLESKPEDCRVRSSADSNNTEIHLDDEARCEMQHAVVSVRIVIERAFCRHEHFWCLEELREIRKRMEEINAHSCGEEESAEFLASAAWIDRGIRIFEEVFRPEIRLW